MTQAIDMLAPDHRVTHYRAMAFEVQYLASESQFEEVREQFMELAKSWLSMADTMERALIENEILPSPATRNWLDAA